jgi:hypothetical protein
VCRTAADYPPELAEPRRLWAGSPCATRRPLRQTGAVGFTDVDLRTLAGQAVYARGEEYVRYVHGLVITGTSAQASIQAKRVYWVELSWATSASTSSP